MHLARSAAMVLGVMGFGAVIGGASGVALSPSVAGAAADGSTVLLSDVGPGFTLADDVPGSLGSHTRRFDHDLGQLELIAFPVTTPPGVRTMFDIFSAADTGFVPQPEPSLELATWLVPEGSELGDSGLASLVFASRDHIFWFTLTTGGAAGIDGPAFVRQLAVRQIAAAGGPPAALDTSRDRTGEDAIVALLPSQPPGGYGLTTSTTVTGSDELEGADQIQSEVVDFLNERSVTATRVWFDADASLAAAVTITRHPYDIFAAAQLGSVRGLSDTVVASTDALTDVDDVILYTDVGGPVDQVGAGFRRGDVFVLVLTQRVESVPIERAVSLTVDMTRLVAGGLPAGDTAPYEFPGTPSKLVGLGLTAALVTAAGGGSAAVSRLRARRVRRRWSGGTLPAPSPAVGGAGAPGAAIALDDDARRLRRHGAVVAGCQLASVNVMVVALAGDFAWTGVAVAVVALVAGLALTRWWQRRELGLLGSKAPPRELVLPRPAGAVVGVLALAVLGVGVAYALKGLRYLVLKPTLAQLKWSDLLGVAPRTVGIVFGVGGFVVAMIGGWLFRTARALGRAGTQRVLEADPRRAALYLRSFDDDSLPLPTIASARRPLFELFSVRGADPFEESVAWELNSYGPVVAVGRPGRSLASLGAAREHLPDETWRDQVASRMENAGIIAVATGETDGLAWELGQIVTGGHLGKTFFVFPPVAPHALDRRWAHTAASLADAGLDVGPLPMPPSLIHTVRLGDDGTPTVTFANRRDEATYRTAVDRALTPTVPAPTAPGLLQPPATPFAAGSIG